MAPEAQLYALKVLDQDGYGYVSDVVLAIDWSVAQGMQIISMSLGLNSDVATLRTACHNAYAAGLLLVAAAGTAALVWAGEPGLTNEQVRLRLQITADDLGSAGRDPWYGYGLVDADEAAPPTDDTPPAQVMGLTVTTVSHSQIDLTWTANSDFDLAHYNVYGGEAPGQLALLASPIANQYSHTGLRASTTYYYKVTAVDTSGNEGLPSEVASGTTSAPPPEITVFEDSFESGFGKWTQDSQNDWFPSNPEINPSGEHVAGARQAKAPLPGEDVRLLGGCQRRSGESSREVVSAGISRGIRRPAAGGDRCGRGLSQSIRAPQDRRHRDSPAPSRRAPPPSCGRAGR